MTSPLFPMWQIDDREYAAICAHLGLTPRPRLFPVVVESLAATAVRATPPRGFARFLAEPRLTRFRIARLDLVTRLRYPDHPVRHRINAVVAVHECDAEAYRELSRAPTGFAAVVGSIFAWGVGFLGQLVLTLFWLAWRGAAYACARVAGPVDPDLSKKHVLVTGVSRGLGHDLMCYCLERGARVTATVRSAEAKAALAARLPADAPVCLVAADLAVPGALVAALQAADVRPETIDVALLSAGTKLDGQSVLSEPALRETFQVNLWAPVELAAWLCSAASAPRAALAIVSSIGRFHGMHGTGGYNASKAALSIWGESLELQLMAGGARPASVTIVEPGPFESAMMPSAGIAKLLAVPRARLVRAIVRGALAGKRVVRMSFWFALLTWALCLVGRGRRARVLLGAKRP